MPDNFGVEDKNFPTSFGGQLIYPFINIQAADHQRKQSDPRARALIEPRTKSPDFARRRRCGSSLPVADQAGSAIG